MLYERIQPKELFREQPKPKYIYVASKYSNGDKFKNTKDSIAVGEELIKLGFVPYLPLLSHFWNEISPHDYQYWLNYDMQWILRCDALLRLPGDSSGADKEVAYAMKMGIPIFYNLVDIR